MKKEFMKQRESGPLQTEPSAEDIDLNYQYLEAEKDNLSKELMRETASDNIDINEWKPARSKDDEIIGLVISYSFNHNIQLPYPVNRIEIEAFARDFSDGTVYRSSTVEDVNDQYEPGEENSIRTEQVFTISKFLQFWGYPHIIKELLISQLKKNSNE